MEPEAKPFVEHMGLEKDEELFEPHLPFEAYSGTHKDATVTVITNGKDNVYNTGVDNVGTVPASLATYLALHKLKDRVDLLINAGTSGGFQRKGGAIGDVYLTTAVSHHDRRIPIPGGFIPYGIGRLESRDSNSSDDGGDNKNGNSTVINPQKLADMLQYKTGVVSTGNSLDKTDTCDQHMMANDASVKDMEAAAIAWTCALLQKPFLGIKVVTDIVDGDIPTQDEFMANLATAAKSLQTALPQVLDAVIGKKCSDL
ncbi:hypothetical protein ACA910_015072 [Epithemia clementina (nom. ined.)]